ncbi:energy-coupled thiamine transporter ThiT, partial [Francisella tularensis]|uniref:energy-coupled thiamine transporter ThiT n=1 Tax=Francisella tularensis TaxID=263 RepID=UPI0017497AEE
KLRSEVREELSQFLFEKTKRRPVVLPILIEVLSYKLPTESYRRIHMKQIKEYTLVLGLVFSVAFIFSFIQSQSKPIIMDFNIMMITTLPIVTLFYRYGCYPTIIVGTIYGVGVGIMAFWAHGDVGLMLAYVLFGVSLSINGLFAKNVHKTLNNKRLNSVWLNVITASVLISLLMIGLTVFNIRYFNVANA